MERRVKFVVLFHAFVNEHHPECAISYIKALVSAGIYDMCDKILTRVRYTDEKTLSSVRSQFAQWKKIEIISVKKEATGYSDKLNKLFKPPRKLNSFQSQVLGETESIVEMLINNELKNEILKYDACMFVHTKNASLNTKYNTRGDQPKMKKLRIGLPPMFFRRRSFCRLLKHAFQNVCFSNTPNNNFVFNTQCIKDLTYEKYVNMYKDHRIGRYLRYKHGVVIFKNRHFFAKWNKRVNRYINK